MLNSKENGKRILKMSKYNGVAEAVSCRIEALNEMLNVYKDVEIASLDKRVRIARKKNNYQYYLVETGTCEDGLYAGKKDREEVKALIQKEYEIKTKKLIQKEIDYLNSILNKYRPDAIINSYDRLYIGRKEMISPIDVSDSDYADIWSSQHYIGKAIDENRIYFETLNGERVRSKSEAIIADTLRKYGIPYHYEKPLQLNNGALIHPDFTVLNARKRKTIYIEHLGMLDDRGYLNDALNRIDAYEDSGIILGDELIITYETEKRPLRRNKVEIIINKYLL